MGLQRTNAILMKALSAISEEVTVSQNEEAEVGGSWFNHYWDGSRYTKQCKWFGTAPWCSPDGCPDGLSAHRSVKKRNELPDGEMLDKFGSSCWSGKKILCCKQI